MAGRAVGRLAGAAIQRRFFVDGGRYERFCVFQVRPRNSMVLIKSLGKGWNPPVLSGDRTRQA